MIQFTSENSIIVKTNEILNLAITTNISDIHIEPAENHYRIRVRKDGELEVINKIITNDAVKIIARIKLSAKIDSSENRLPQDGSFTYENNNFRINTIPTVNGEKVTIRVLKSTDEIISLDQIGFNKLQLEIFKKKLSNLQGLILITGPTSSGKTTTLYSAINYLNQDTINICSIEDPVESKINNINQTTIHEKINLDTALMLRALLRQDPDVIIIGEIRDPETAKTALQAANTGHLVLATLHANSSIDTVKRLQSLGIADYYLQGNISLIINQRLIKKLCKSCKAIDFVFKIKNIPKKIFKAKGCENCNKGYSGRISIFDFLIDSSNLKSRNIKPLAKSAFEKMLAGVSSVEEVRRFIDL